MGQAFLSRQKASRHMWRNFRIPWEFKLFFFYRHTEMFLNDFIRILTIFGFIASLFRHLRTEKFSKAALFLFHMFHLLPNIRYFSGAAGTKQEQTKCVDNIDEGTYWVDLTRRVEHRQFHGCRSAFTLWGGGVLAGRGKRVCPNFRLHKKTKGTRPRWRFSSRGKPRSQ